MNRKSWKYLLWVLFLIILPSTIYSSEQSQKKKISTNSLIKRKLDSLINSELKDVFVGIKIENLKTNKDIYQFNANKLFRPASNQKLITSAAAIEFLPDNFNFKTQLYLNGNIQDTVLNGNLYIKGYGDPLFKSSDMDSLINFLVQKQIKIINGNIVGDISYFDQQYWGKGWMWDDEPEAFVPYITPLSINSNIINITVSPSSNIGEKALLKIFPENNFIGIISNAITVSEKETSDIHITRNRFENLFIISGKIPITENTKEFSLSIYRPEEFFIKLFNERLEKSGIRTLGQTYIDTTSSGDLVCEITHNIDNVLNLVNKNSDNLCAENLFKTLSAEIFRTKGTNSGSALIIKRFLSIIGVDTNKIVIADGSGVSRYNLASPETFTNVIKYFYQTDSVKFRRLINSLSIGGVDGTLKNRFKNLEQKIKGKTGTHSDATSLSGIYIGKSGNIVVFSILINNYPNKNSLNSKKYKDIEEKIVNILAKYY